LSADAGVRVGRGTAVNWTAWIAARVLALATLIMLTRALGADDVGALLAALAAGVLGAALATGGLADATARQASAAGHAGGAFGRGDLKRAFRRFGAVLPLVLLAVVVITAGSSTGFGISQVVAAAALATTQGLTTITASVFRARGQAARFALATNVASSLGRAAIALLALVGDLGATPVLWAFVAVNAAVAGITWLDAVRDLPDTTSAATGEGALQLGGMVWSLLGNLDVVTVGVVLGAGAAGTYSVSLRVAELGAQFIIAISLFYVPEATRLFVRGRRDALVSLYRAVSRWCALTTLLTVGVGFVAAEDIAAILFPDDPATSATLLRILLVGYAIQGALGVSYGTLIAVGAFRAIRRSSLVSLPLIVSGTVALTLAWDVTGAAFATLITYAGLNLWWTREAILQLGASPFDAHYRRSLAVCMASWAAGSAAVLLLGDAGSVATLAAAAGAALAAWLLLVPAARALPASELALVRMLWRRAPERPL
jgi:O-antigen/teichoic acid export membrane protein